MDKSSEGAVWIPVQGVARHRCSYCESEFKVDTIMGEPVWKYCPYCGNRMKRVLEKQGEGDEVAVRA